MSAVENYKTRNFLGYAPLFVLKKETSFNIFLFE